MSADLEKCVARNLCADVIRRLGSRKDESYKNHYSQIDVVWPSDGCCIRMIEVPWKKKVSLLHKYGASIAD